jgi:hypothetical protein
METTNLNWFRKCEKVISVFANAAVIAGIMFAFYQIIQSNNFEKRRIAIEAISPTRSNDFLISYTKLINAYREKRLSSISLNKDLYYVMNVYDNIAILYLNGLADKSLIKENSYTAIMNLELILTAMSYPEENRSNFDRLLSELNES